MIAINKTSNHKGKNSIKLCQLNINNISEHVRLIDFSFLAFLHWAPLFLQLVVKTLTAATLDFALRGSNFSYQTTEFVELTDNTQ